ncbi:MAG: class I SAM-dependent methyltransferase [Proteobacteria bacterium]|nr:class I SAM-dependent methyltransferase [Pseudomonadota bacterium]
MLNRILFVAFLLCLQLFTPTFAADLSDYRAAGRVPTINKMGWAHPGNDAVTQQFLSFCKEHPGAKVLEIGAAYGDVSKLALENGANVWVNDLEPKHLSNFLNSIPKDKQNKAHVVAGEFPTAVTLPPHSFDAILVARVFPLMKPEQFEASIVAIKSLLKAGGKVYVVAETPYIKSWSGFIPEYEQRKTKGERFPGYIAEPEKYNPASAAHLSGFLNFLDPQILTREFKNKGFEIIWCQFMNRADFPESMRLDGRESVGLIAGTS